MANNENVSLRNVEDKEELTIRFIDYDPAPIQYAHQRELIEQVRGFVRGIPYFPCKAVPFVNQPVVPMIGHRLPTLMPSRHRSKRLTKKLHKRGAIPLYGPSLTWNPRGRVLNKLLYLVEKTNDSKRS